MKKILKGIYRILPFKQFLFKNLKAVWTPPESIYKHLYFKGIFKIQLNGGHSFKMKHYGYQLENDIFWVGLKNTWQKESLNIWIKLCSRSKVIFDVGANTGIYSLLAKATNSTSSVYAFEPVKRVFEKLVNNNKLNQFDINCVDKAISNVDGTASIYDDNSEHEYTASLNRHHRHGYPSYDVGAITLDKFVSLYKIPRIDLLKIDVERHEPEVLEGFKRGLKDFRPSILIEVLSEEIAGRINHLTCELNYLYYAINEENGLKRVSGVDKSEGYNYLFCTAEVAKFLELDPNTK